MDDTDVRPTTEGTPTGPAPAAPTEFVSVAEFAAAWNRSTYQVRTWLTAGRVDGAHKVSNEWRIPARHLPWMPGAQLPSAGNKGGLG